MKKLFLITALLLFGCVFNGVAATEAPQAKTGTAARPDGAFQGNMFFLYYKDLPRAVAFYQNTLGLQLVLDYGFAKGFRVSQSCFVTLVDETKGMHKTSEPRTVTLAFITQEVDGWYTYLKEKGVKISHPLGNATRHPTRGFVAVDPEGYLLEFETFLKHDQNTKLRRLLEKTSPIYPPKQAGTRPANLGVQGNVLWLYYKDVAEAQAFYSKHLGLELLVDQGFAKVYSSSPTAFIGLVDEAKGLHRFSKEKSVNIGFITPDIDRWYGYLVKKGLTMRNPLKEAEGGKVRAFVTFDPAGYYLEFDTFNRHPKNETILKLLEEKQ